MELPLKVLMMKSLWPWNQTHLVLWIILVNTLLVKMILKCLF